MRILVLAAAAFSILAFGASAANAHEWHRGYRGGYYEPYRYVRPYSDCTSLLGATLYGCRPIIVVPQYYAVPPVQNYEQPILGPLQYRLITSGQKIDPAAVAAGRFHCDAPRPGTTVVQCMRVNEKEQMLER